MVMLCIQKIHTVLLTIATYIFLHFLLKLGGSRRCDRMVVRFTTTYALSSYHH